MVIVPIRPNGYAVTAFLTVDPKQKLEPGFRRSDVISRATDTEPDAAASKLPWRLSRICAKDRPDKRAPQRQRRTHNIDRRKNSGHECCWSN
jgi:hypothetical protein